MFFSIQLFYMSPTSWLLELYSTLADSKSFKLAYFYIVLKPCLWSMHTQSRLLIPNHMWSCKVKGKYSSSWISSWLHRLVPYSTNSPKNLHFILMVKYDFSWANQVCVRNHNYPLFRKQLDYIATKSLICRTMREIEDHHHWGRDGDHGWSP